MGARIFKGNSIEECLKTASSELHISLENLNYKVIDTKKSIFKKTITISVEESSPIIKDNDGRVYVLDGKVVVKDPGEGGKPASISGGNAACLKVNGETVEGKRDVYEKDEISCSFDEQESQRTLDVKISTNKLEAMLNIKYVPLIKYKLKNSDEVKVLTLEKEVAEEIMPPAYTLQNIKDELSRFGIIFGIQESELKEYLKGDTPGQILAAKGIPAVDDTDDVIIYKFKTDKTNSHYEDNSYTKIDYRNINLISSVKKGDMVAVRNQGIVGKPGTDIFGKVIKKKEGKKKVLKVGTGCELVDDNTVIASVDGRPNIKSNIIYVNEIYEVAGDVDIKSGNVKFIGDVKIHGNVMEGMRVEAGGAVEIKKSVENSKILASGDIVIQANAIMSTIIAGGNDVTNLRRINDLQEFVGQIKNLEDTVAEIKKFNLLGNGKEDGEIIKILLETKFKFMNKTCISIIKDSVHDEANYMNKVVLLIREMLVGMAPLGIKNFGQLEELIVASKDKIEELKQNLALPVNMAIAYCQDSKLSSSGNIIITGKGQYVSNITAYNSISFTFDNSVARGGELNAGKEIYCKTVGSTGGVVTKLSVESHGHIFIDIAYQNTKLCIGGKEYVLDIPYRNVHAYQDSKGDLVVEKLKL